MINPNRPEARMEFLKPEEKEIMLSELNKRLLKKGLIFFLPFILCISALAYVNLNFNYIELGLTEDQRTWLNVGFVFIGFLAGRLFIGHYLEYLKDSKSAQKKVLFGKVNKLKGTSFRVGRFEVNASSKTMEGISEGDVIEATCTIKTGVLISFEKVQM